jgi:hypothetical protein
MRSVIALCGAPGSGKSEVRKILERDYGYRAIRVAGPLKAMAYALQLDERHIEGALKRQPCGRLSGATPTKLMQVLGREVPDALGVPDLWARMWLQNAEASNSQRIVVEDHRYPNEPAFFRAFGPTVVWRVVRDFKPDVGAMKHAAENQILHADRDLMNTGTLGDLSESVRYLMEDSI